MIGIVAGIFCTLIVAWACSYAFKLDEKWFCSLQMPAYMLPRGAFTVMVGATYVSCIISISRLVEHKRIFPSMLFFVGLGVCSVLFVVLFFACKQLLWGMVFMGATLALAFVLFFRFLGKDFKIALAFLPAFAFDLYGFLVVLYIAMAN